MLTHNGQHRLLFVDDDAPLAHAFAKLARGWGYEVDVASSGRRALELAQRADYAAILIDASHSSDIDPADVIGEIASGQRASVFVLTSRDPEQAARLVQAHETRVASILPKPWDPDQFAL